MKNENDKPVSRMLVTGVVLFYVFAALAMVMANKWVLNTTEAPLFFLWSQLVIAIVLFVLCNICGLLPDRLTLDMNIAKALIPTVALSVLGLSFSNYTLKYVDASFYQVARGLVLPFTVAVSMVMLNARPSLKIYIACFIVTVGFFVGVCLDGIRVSKTGVAFGVASSMLTALHSVVIKRSLPIVENSTIALSWYTNVLGAIALSPIVLLVGEAPAVVTLFNAPAEIGKMSPLRTFVWGSLITGVLGFLMSIACLLSIKVTSPITHMVSSAVRGVAASLLGIWLFHDIITTGRAASIATILAGSALYTWFKNEELVAASGVKISSTTMSRRGSYERLHMDDIEKGEAEMANIKR